MKSATAKFCCRFCKIQGQHARGSPTYYCPNNPPLDGTEDANGPEFHTNEYNVLNMPMRDHERHIMDALLVGGPGRVSASQGVETGINGFPSILRLKTLRFPQSFPLDIMYLLYLGAMS